MQTDYQFLIDHKAKVEHVQVIQDGVVEFNTPFIGTKTKFCVFLKDKDNETLGGASGNVWPELKLLYLDFVHIAEPLRRLGYGRKLMQEVEEEARRLGCIAILLDTYSFQAEGFYTKLGFTRIGFLEKQFGNYDRIYMRKNLE